MMQSCGFVESALYRNRELKWLIYQEKATICCFSKSLYAFRTVLAPRFAAKELRGDRL